MMVLLFMVIMVQKMSDGDYSKEVVYGSSGFRLCDPSAYLNMALH